MAPRAGAVRGGPCDHAGAPQGAAQSLGRASRVCCQGAQALQQLHLAAPYHVLLLDRRLPDMDGLTPAHTIKAQARFQALPLVLLHAFAERPVQDGTLPIERFSPSQYVNRRCMTAW